MTPDAASSELPLKAHAIVAPKDAVAMEPSLHELTLVSVEERVKPGYLQTFIGINLMGE